MTAANSVVVLSEHSIICPKGKTKTFICKCNPELAPHHKCSRCICGRRRKTCVAISCKCQGRCATTEARVTIAPTSQPPQVTSPHALRGSEVSAHEGDSIADDEAMDGCAGADDRRRYGDSERDGWEDECRSCASAGSHADTDSVVSDVEVGRLEDFFNDGL